MSKIETEDFGVLEKRLNSLVESIKFQSELIQNIENKLGNQGLVNIDKFYSLQEVSKIVGLSEYHIKKDIESGQLKPLKKGGRTVFNKEQINTYIKE